MNITGLRHLDELGDDGLHVLGGDGLQHGAAELGDTLGVTESGANRRNPRAPMRPAGRWNLVASQRQTPLSGGVTRDDAALCEVGEGIGVAW